MTAPLAAPIARLPGDRTAAATTRGPERPVAVHPVGVGPEGVVGVVAPHGVFDGRELRRLDRAMQQGAAASVVIDLTECTLADPTAVSELQSIRWDLAAGQVCLVCRRLSGRRLLGRFGVRLAVFGTVEDAVQALLLLDAGYGRGWT